MFYCDECKTETLNSVHPVCGKPARKYWWSFPRDAKHPQAPHGYRVYYNPDGTVQREEEY